MAKKYTKPELNNCFPKFMGCKEGITIARVRSLPKHCPKFWRTMKLRWLVRVDGQPYRYWKTRNEAQKEAIALKNKRRPKTAGKGLILGHSLSVIAFFAYAACVEQGRLPKFLKHKQPKRKAVRP